MTGRTGERRRDEAVEGTRSSLRSAGRVQSEPVTPPIDIVAGARPNFMKIAPNRRVFEACRSAQRIDAMLETLIVRR